MLHAYRIPAIGTKDYYALDMLTTLLSSGQSSRLQKAVVDEKQKAVNVGAFPYSLRRFRTYLLLMELAIRELVQMIWRKSMQEELEKVKNEKID